MIVPLVYSREIKTNQSIKILKLVSPRSRDALRGNDPRLTRTASAKRPNSSWTNSSANIRRGMDINYSDFQQRMDMLDKPAPSNLSNSRKQLPWLTSAIRHLWRKKQRIYNHTTKAKNKDRYLGILCALKQHNQGTKKSWVGLYKWYSTGKLKWGKIEAILVIHIQPDDGSKSVLSLKK